jgi:hypothetical protein
MGAGCRCAKCRWLSRDCEIVTVFRVDYDFVAAIGGLLEVDVNAFGDDVAGVHREVDTGALRGAFGDVMACVLAGRLVDSLVCVLGVLFF